MYVCVCVCVCVLLSLVVHLSIWYSIYLSIYQSIYIYHYFDTLIQLDKSDINRFFYWHLSRFSLHFEYSNLSIYLSIYLI